MRRGAGASGGRVVSWTAIVGRESEGAARAPGIIPSFTTGQSGAHRRPAAGPQTRRPATKPLLLADERLPDHVDILGLINVLFVAPSEVNLFTSLLVCDSLAFGTIVLSI